MRFLQEHKRLIGGGLAAILAGGLLGYGIRMEIELLIMNRMLRGELAGERQTASAERNYYENLLSLASSTNQNLQQHLQGEQSRNNAIESQVLQLSGNVNQLTQLQNTDPQLLEKYSRVYFLNENYQPKSLTAIDSSYLYNPKRTEQFLAPALPYLLSLMNAAKIAGIDLKIASAYRSFGTQAALHTEYLVTYGIGTNQFSAEEGYSEHQLGTAADFITSPMTALTTTFASTSAYAWLQSNAYKYGFVLSYPKGNPYYIFEPWHWRFVGVSLATWLYQSNQSFYDVSQRTINQYLISIFN
ncbi:MAG: M15 family metallopeptidase [Patescibacteria group bacterium]|nr:M15 family metallopeptidase [Patescibacteria group bacterium]